MRNPEIPEIPRRALEKRRGGELFRLDKLMAAAALVVSMVVAEAIVPMPSRVVASAAEPATRLATIAVRPQAAAATVSAAGEPTPFLLSHLGARWTGDAAAVVEARWETAAGWSGWVPLGVD